MPAINRSSEDLQREIDMLRERVKELESLQTGCATTNDSSDNWKHSRAIDRTPIVREIPIHVVERPSDVGTILNMTSRGLGIRGIQCRKGETLSLKISPPDSLNLESFSFDAICRWAHEDKSEGGHFSGFEITRISEPEKAKLGDFLVALGYEFLREQFRRQIGEEALKVIESSSDLICRVTESGAITFVNRAFSKFSSLSRNSLIGLNLEDFIPEESKAGFRQFLQSHITDDYHGFYESPVVKATGETYLYHWTVDTRRNPDKCDIEFQLVGRDITEPKRQEQILRDSHHELELRILDRTSQLEQANLRLNEEIDRRRRIEQALDRKLWSLTRPNLDIRNIDLTDLIDVTSLQKINDCFSDLWGAPLEIVGSNGQPIKVIRNVPHFYDCINSTEEGRRIVQQKNSEIISKLNADEILPVENFILKGEFSYAIPINIQGRTVGAWKIGQSLLKEPEPNEVNNLAARIGVDADDLLNSLKTSPRISKETLLKAANFLNLVSNQVAMLGLQNLSQSRMIHELKEAKTQIRSSEQMLRNLLESAPIGIFLTSQGVISFANRALSQMFAFSSTAEMVGLRIDSFFRNGTITEKLMAVGGHADVRTIERADLKAIRQDNELFDVDVYCGKMSLDPESAVIGFVIDKSQENALRHQLLHAQKMEALGTLAGGIAHDFNNILTIIMGYSEMALLEHARNHQINSQLNQILEASKRARDLVSQILTFSRKGQQQKQPLNVVPIIKETVKFLDASFPSTIKIQSRIRDDGAQIVGDPTQIHQVLMNLCSNAGHAMRKTGGILEIDLEVVENSSLPAAGIHVEGSADYLKLTVKDSGPGIEPEIRDRIFEPYFTTKPVGEGSGLGLAVAHGIVTSHEGVIRLDESYTNGACFEVYLPMAKPSENLEELESETNLFGNQTIMVVDDEKAVSDIAKEILESFGYTVHAFYNPVVALNMFRIGPYDFDLVLTDLTMNEMTGLILADQIKKIRPEIPLALLTGYDAANEISSQSPEIFEAIIQKPFTKKTLGKAVKQVLQKSLVPDSVTSKF